MADGLNGNASTMPASEVKEVAEIRTLASTLLDRIAFFRQAGISFDGRRDLYDLLGYPRVLTYRLFRARYMRGGIAKRVVDAYPIATWRGGVTVYENEEADTAVTPFEQAWRDLETQHQIWSMLQRADILAGLSTYAVLLIGAPGDLSTPLPKGKPGDLLFFSPFSGGGGPGGDRLSRSMAMDADCSIMEFDTNTESPRFGKPLTYQLRRTNLSSPMLQRPVHWSRILHIAEGLLSDEVYGTPRLESCYNLLDDLDKVTGGGAEAFWLRANQGLHLDVDKDMALSSTKETIETIEALKDQAEEYQQNINRILRTRGVTVTPLGSSVADFSNPADAILTQIAGTMGIPKRLLLGSEMGQLASGQDKDNWNTQVQDRRTSYAGPLIIRPLVDRLIEYGYLPTPTRYDVEWPIIEELTEAEKGTLANALATVNRTFGATVFTGDEIREKCYRLKPADDQSTDMYKTEGAKGMAMVNKFMGLTVFTPAEMRKTWYGWQPLPADEETPVAMVRATLEPGETPAAPDASATPAAPGAPATPAALAAAMTTLEGATRMTAADAAATMAALESAVEANDAAAVGRILGLVHRDVRALAHRYASTQIELSPAIAERLLAVGAQIPDGDLAEDGRETEPHVTVKYGLTDDDPSDLAALLGGWGSITLVLGPLGFFAAPDYDVVYAAVRSPDLVEMNEAISNQLDVVDTQPSYVPHATVAYVKSGLGPQYAGRTDLAGLMMTADRVTFAPAEGEPTEVPLG